MKLRSVPINEKARLEAVRSYHILDTEDEQEYDDIVELACQLCDTPIALITLIDENRQWFKAKKGLEFKETPISIAFCAHTIRQNEIMIVSDTLEDKRFFDNPLVTQYPFIRFYAGIPLIAPNGLRLGTLAVLDRKPKNLSGEQHKSMRILAKQIASLLKLRINNLELDHQVREKTVEIRDILERVSDAFVAVDQRWKVTYINDKAAEITNKHPKEVIGKILWCEFPEAVASEFQQMAENAMATQQHQFKEAYFPPYNKWIESHIYPSSNGLSIYFKDITERKNSEIAVKHGEDIRRLIMDSALDAIICMDKSGAVTFWNPQAEKIFGWKEEDTLGRPLADLIIPAEYRDRHAKGMKRYLETGEGPFLNRLIEITGINNEQQEFPIELTIIPIKQGEREFLCSFIRDVREKKKSENALLQSDKQYRSIFENAAEGIYQSTPEGKFITANPSMAKMFGYDSPEELIATVTDIGSQIYEDPTTRLEMKAELEKYGHATNFELKAVKKNKEIIWVRAHIRATKGKEGKIELFEGTMEDITERKEAEEKLRLQEQLDQIISRAQSLFIGSENSRAAFDALLNDLLSITMSEYGFIGEVLSDANGQPFLKTHTITNIAWNEETKKYYNENIQEGLVFSNLKTLFGEVMVSGKPVISNSPSTDPRRGGIPHGHPPLNAFLGLPFGSDGNIEGMLGLSNRPGGYSETLIKFLEPLTNTITHLIKAAQSEKLRREAETALRNSENKLRAFIRSTPDASILVGKNNFEVIAFNRSANEFMEATNGTLLCEGEIFTRFIADDHRPIVAQFLQNGLKGETSRGEFLIPNIKTGKKGWWLTVFMPAYDNDGTIFGVIVNSTNVNEIKHAELKIKKQLKELQKTNQELDRFVYSVSHDLRAPLATILGLINIAEIESPAGSFNDYLTMIRNNINRLDGFIKDILDYSLNSRKDLQIDKINFPKLLDEIQQNFKLFKGADRLIIEVAIHDDAAFFSDKLRIAIILNNLFSNAIKYQDYQKAKSHVLVKIITSKDKVWIHFSDNGIGIEEKHVTKIFDMFYRGSESSKGSGLGLYIVKETVSKLEGTVKVESEYGISTTFSISIPNSGNNHNKSQS